MLMNILKGSRVFPYVISMLRTATASSAKKKKKRFYKMGKLIQPLKWGLDKHIPFFFPNYKFYNGHIQLLGKAYVHHSENFALFYVSQ